MPPFRSLPSTVTTCCFCVNDLKTAVAIIAVLGIVTSPAISWAIIRHSYVVRMSCFVTTNGTRPDVMDIKFDNVLSFGFGANAGLTPSCLRPRKMTQNINDGDTISVFRSGSGTVDNSDKEDRTVQKLTQASTQEARSDLRDLIKLIIFIRVFGWIVLILDLIFVIACVIFLVKLFRGTVMPFMKWFMWCLVFAILFSFLYGMTYVIICLVKWGSFHIFEFIFVIFDLILWIYFLIVLNSYRLNHLNDQS